MPNSPIAISALSAAVTLAAGDLLLVVAAGTTSKMTPANLLASLDLYHGPIRRRAGGGVVYNHTDLATAVAAMAAGQSLELDPGVFALGTTQLVMPANVTIRGSGAVGPLHWGNTANMDGTIITFAGTEAGQGCGIVPGSNNYFENLSMVATDVQGCPFGCTTVGSQQGGLGGVVRGWRAWM